MVKRLLPATGREDGFSLTEAIVAAAIAVIAVLGLAHSFGIGRALIDRYAIARGAMAVAERRLEQLSILPGTAPELAVDSLYKAPFFFNGDSIGTETWTVEWLDDPSDGTGSSDSDPHDLKKVTEEVRWRMASDADVIRLSRLFAVH